MHRGPSYRAAKIQLTSAARRRWLRVSLDIFVSGLALAGCLFAGWLPGWLLAGWLAAGRLAAGWLAGCWLAGWLANPFSSVTTKHNIARPKLHGI